MVKKIPENSADLERMIDTSANFDGIIRREKLADISEMREGLAYEHLTRIAAHPYNNTVLIEHFDLVVTEMHNEHSFASTSQNRTSANISFDEFRTSSYWEDAMEAFVGGDADASAFAEYSASNDGDIANLSIEVESRYTDGLGNKRIGRPHDRVCIWVDRSAWATVQCGERSYDGDIREMMKLIEEAKAFREHGIVLDGDALSIKLPNTTD